MYGYENNRNSPVYRYTRTASQDASANVFNITLEKSIFLQERKNNNYNTDKLPKGHCKMKLKKTMKMKPLTNAEDNWGGGWRQQTI